ncbi:MAG: FUSC family protein [Myxococcales bacterium]|nr:FUSC family protein [Myxococcales bacterium]
MGFTLTNPVFLAGKSAAACALALLLAQALGVPDAVTASFVAVLCCSPGALMGLRTSVEQLVGSVLGGVLGTLGAVMHLTPALGVPLAVGVAVLCTHSVGFHRGTIAAAFTALFLQLVSFGDPLETFVFRLEAVGIAGLSAFVVNVASSSLFYGALFEKRLARLSLHIDALLLQAVDSGPSGLVVAFPHITELRLQLEQALRELRWRRNAKAEARVALIISRVEWLEDVVHLAVNLEYSLPPDDSKLGEFLAWLPAQEGPAPQLPEAGRETRERILAVLARRVSPGAPPADL